jgi:hypothetical protein
MNRVYELSGAKIANMEFSRLGGTGYPTSTYKLFTDETKIPKNRNNMITKKVMIPKGIYLFV